MPLKNILIVVDNSDFSVKTVKWGFEFALRLNAVVGLIYVVDISKALGNVDAGILPQEAVIVLKKEAELTLDRLAAMYKGSGLIKFMPEGHPLKEIIRTAEDWEADLIIAGKHGRSGLLRLLSGNITSGIVRNSKFPLVIVPYNK